MTVLLFFFLFGAIAPLIPWAITRKYPNSFFRYVNIPVMLSGVGFIPPANAVNYVPWSIVNRFRPLFRGSLADVYLPGWLRLPAYHSAEALCMVDQVQLRPLRCSRLWRGRRYPADLLHTPMAAGWPDWNGHDWELVGQHRLAKHGGRPQRAA
jgi:hypothetical protein